MCGGGRHGSNGAGGGSYTDTGINHLAKSLPHEKHKIVQV